MLTGEIRNQIDRIWDQFWSGGISNPLEVIEQITHLLFMRRLDEIQELEERKAARTGKFRHAPAFSPATASARDREEGCGWSPGRRAEPAFASPLPRR
jgi:type I restriction enzyme M protein